MNLMFQPLRRYADFYGRARRTEYWLFRLFEAVVYAVLFAVFFGVMSVGDAVGRTTAAYEGYAAFGGVIIILSGAAWLGLLLPGLAVTARRFHDVGASAWLLLLHIVPLGGVAIFVLTVIDGAAGPNIHGPDPKGRGDRPVADIFS